MKEKSVPLPWLGRDVGRVGLLLLTSLLLLVVRLFPCPQLVLPLRRRRLCFKLSPLHEPRVLRRGLLHLPMPMHRELGDDRRHRRRGERRTARGRQPRLRGLRWGTDEVAEMPQPRTPVSLGRFRACWLWKRILRLLREWVRLAILRCLRCVLGEFRKLTAGPPDGWRAWAATHVGVGGLGN